MRDRNNQPHRYNHYAGYSSTPNPTGTKHILLGCATSYLVPAKLRTQLMDELKQKQIELGKRPAEPIETIDAGFETLEFDPARCMEALMVKGKVQQCPHFKTDGHDYCLEHLK